MSIDPILSDTAPGKPKLHIAHQYVRVERRHTKVARLTITEILDKMQSLADTYFDGDLQNNTPAIFNKLSRESKRTFLRRSLLTLWELQIDLARTGYQEIVVEDDLRIHPEKVEQERQELEAAGSKDQRKFNSKFKRGAILVTLCVVIGAGSVVLFTKPVSDTVPASELSLFDRGCRAISYIVALNKK